MVMPSPSLPSLSLPAAGATTGRPSAPVSMPVGKGAVRPAAGRQSFAGVLAEQEPQDHGTADQSSSVDDDSHQAAPQDGDKAPADRADVAGKQLSSTSSVRDGKTAQPAPVSAPEAGFTEAGTVQTAPQPVPHGDDGQDAEDRKAQDEASSVSLEAQMLSLASFMTSSQPVPSALPGQSPEGDVAGRTAGTVSVTASSGMGPVSAAADDMQQRVAAVLETGSASRSQQAASSSVAGSPSSTAGQLIQALSSGGTAGSVPMVPDMAQAVSRAAETVSSHVQGTAVHDSVVALHESGMARKVETGVASMQRDALTSVAARPTARTVTDQAAAAVKAMTFQPGHAGPAVSSILNGGQVPSSHQETIQKEPDGQTDSLFGLMVRAASGTVATSSSGSGHQEEAGGGQPQSAHDDTSSVSTEEGEAGVSAGQGDVSSSFAGQGASLTEGSSVVQPVETRGSATGVLPHEAKQADGVAGLSTLQTGGSAASVLSGRAVGQAGTLTMTVMTSDETSVHVQLDRSAEGLSALSLQGQDDGTTEALQKTHHVLARQLDEVGMHSGVMKIDVLPTESGQMAGGQNQNMPQHQGQGAYQSAAGQTADQSAFQQAGGFLAGGDGGGAWQQGRQARQGEAVSIPLRSESSFGPEEEVSASTGSPSGRVGHLNISV